MASFSTCLLRRASSLARVNPAVSRLSRPIHVSVTVRAGQNWRLRNGKSRSGNEFGPLTDLPDWTFIDGRPSVLGKGQLKRQVKQYAFSRRIRRMLDEMDTAKAKSSETQQKNEEGREEEDARDEKEEDEEEVMQEKK